MRELPESAIYEEGLRFWPYKDSLATVLERVVALAPPNGILLDIMCGPGYLLGEIAKKRPDLKLTGVDIDKRYIPYGRKTYPGVTFEQGDVLSWQTTSPFDVVICTGSVHHVPYEQQADAVRQMAAMVKPEGTVIISDAHIDDYKSELERQQAAAKLGYEYLRVTIANKASDPVIDWTIDILWNDVFGHEFKTSLKKRLPVYEQFFEVVEAIKTWPKEETEYGDYIAVLKPK